MPNRINPDTSHSAYKQVKQSDMRERHFAKIKAGLEFIGKGTYEEIAAQIRLDKHQVGRRLSEMERHEPPLVYKTPEKRPTSQNRQAYVYQLTPPGIKVEKPLPGNSVGDFAANLIQKTLF